MQAFEERFGAGEVYEDVSADGASDGHWRGGSS